MGAEASLRKHLSSMFLIGTISLCYISAISLVYAREASALQKLSFLHGTWRHVAKDGSIEEEYWSAPEADSLVGHCRFIKDGKTSFYELLSIVSLPKKGGIVLRMKHCDGAFVPWDEKAEAGDCKLMKLGADEAFFDNNNPLHRVTVSYKCKAANSLSVVVKDTQGGKTSTFPFEYQRHL